MSESKGEAESSLSISLSEDGPIGISSRLIRNFHHKITRKTGKRTAQKIRKRKTLIIATPKPRRRCSSPKCRKKKIRKKKKRKCCLTSPIPVIVTTESTINTVASAIVTTATVSTSIISSNQATTAVITSSVGITTASASVSSELMQFRPRELSTMFFK